MIFDIPSSYKPSPYGDEILKYVLSHDDKINQLVGNKNYEVTQDELGYGTSDCKYANLTYSFSNACIGIAAIGIQGNKCIWPAEQTEPFILGHMTEDYNLEVDAMFHFKEEADS